MNNYKILFDLEATCWDSDAEQGEQPTETIEIGAIRYCPRSFDIVDTFETLICPKYSHVSKFCTKLTNITPGMVEGKWFFRPAYESFQHWAGYNAYFLAWGQYDYFQLKKDCERQGLTVFPERRYMKAKQLYQYWTGKRALGISKYIQQGIVSRPLEQHRALNDCYMTLEVLRNVYFS